MERLSMCRVCLEKDIRLHSIVETHLKEMYESLVLMPWETTDARPILACYICYARLKNCYELRKSCFESEELFTQMLSCNVLKPLKLQEINNKKRLTVQNVSNLSIGHALEINTIDVGEETLTIDVKFEQNYPEDIDENALKDNIRSEDSDDDPLIVVKKEQSNIGEDALEENSVTDIIQSADSDDEPLINVKKEQSGDWTSGLTLKGFKKTVQGNPEDLTFRKVKGHKLKQDTLQEVNKATAVDKTEVTFNINDDNKERPTSVPRSERVQYKCDTCQQRYSSKCKLERHIRVCSDVSKIDLSRESGRSTHTPTAQKPHQCTVCKKHFSSKGYLNYHMRRQHKGEKLVKYNKCKKQFSEKNILRRHLRTDSREKKFQCNICGKYLAKSSGLVYHMRTHTGEKPYRCKVCKKRYAQAEYLKVHMRTHTGRKPYHCNICEKQFSRSDVRRRHMRIHTGEKPFHCSICKKQFPDKHKVTNHMRTHTGEKPFQCDVCKNFFSDKGNLGKHMRTHTQETCLRTK